MDGKHIKIDPSKLSLVMMDEHGNETVLDPKPMEADGLQLEILRAAKIPRRFMFPEPKDETFTLEFNMKAKEIRNKMFPKVHVPRKMKKRLRRTIERCIGRRLDRFEMRFILLSYHRPKGWNEVKIDLVDKE